MKTITCLAILASALLNAASIQAATTAFANGSAFAATYPGATIENWDAYVAGTQFPAGATINGITYTYSFGPGASNEVGIVTNVWLYTTPENTFGRTPTGDLYFFSSDSLTFSFQTPISAFAIDINTEFALNNGYRAITSTGEASLSAIYPGFGQFLGFSSDTPFTSVTFVPTSAASGFGYVLDTLRYVPAGANVPDGGSSPVLLVSALFVSLQLLRHKRIARHISASRS